MPLASTLFLCSCGGSDPIDVPPDEEGSDRPVLHTTAFPDAELGRPYRASLDVSGGTAPYTWIRRAGDRPPGTELEQSTGELLGTPSLAGDFSFTVVVIDAKGAADTGQVSLRVVPADPLVITPFPDLVATVGVPFSYQFQATGADGGPYLWSATSADPSFSVPTLPTGLAVDRQGRLSGTPGYPAGTYRFQLMVGGGEGVRQRDTTTVVELQLRAPSGLQVDSVALPDIRGGEPYSAAVTASGGVPPYTFTPFNSPPPADIALGPSGELSGTASLTNRPTGPGVLGVLVTDAVGASAFRFVPYTYVAAPLTIPDMQFPDGTVGMLYESMILVHTGPSVEADWSVTGGALPDGLSIQLVAGSHSGSEWIAGTPSAVGTSGFDLTVSSNGETATRHFSITIRATPITIVTSALPNARRSTAYQVFLVASGGTAPYHWSVESGALPAGLELSDAGELAGTPTTSGVFAFRIRATDSSGGGLDQSATVDLSLTVDP